MISPINAFYLQLNACKDLADPDDCSIDFAMVEQAKLALQALTKVPWISIQSGKDPTCYLFTCSKLNTETIPRAIAKHIHQEKVNYLRQKLPTIKDKKLLLCLSKTFHAYASLKQS